MREIRLQKLRVVVCPDPALLLERAAEDFLRPAPTPQDIFPSPPYLLVLRQGGLRDDLFSLAARRGVPGWFDPPVCVFHELPAWLGASDRRSLGDFERGALLEHLLRQAGGAVFRGREGVFLAPIERLFGELAAEAVTAEDFAAAIARLQDRQTFERTRDEALRDVYRAYRTALERLNRRDGRDTIADVAAAVRTNPDAVAERLGGRREIRIVGLADLRGGWRLLLDALAGCRAVDRVVLYHTEQLPVGAPTPATGLLRISQPVGAAEVIAARDEDVEMEAVAARVRELVDGGVAPDRIAVIPRDGRPYVDLALRALEAAGVPATARRRVALLTIPVVRAVVALLEAAAQGWTRHALAGLGAQPYFAADVDVRVVNYIGYRRRVAGLGEWSAAFDRLVEEARAAEEAAERQDEGRPRSLPVAWVERARERFAAVAAVASPMDEARPLAGWLAWLDDWLARDPWRIEERCTSPRPTRATATIAHEPAAGAPGMARRAPATATRPGTAARTPPARHVPAGRPRNPASVERPAPRRAGRDAAAAPRSAAIRQFALNEHDGPVPIGHHEIDLPPLLVSHVQGGE